ncbi:ferrochelatase [Dyella sp. LX-66]|uniref:ferrochelatase n=1 Tax=unclassified Dyella TaxID=2634549 RepID=UPI001BE0FDBE|nr:MULTISPECIES: ferrochelatase [unclassified Dyella]MBT2119424.1 ferrochelatase [Dyella sp. LX-1]MBT2138643.1 ferrochelatase [Dyella sp. LX-66]
MPLSHYTGLTGLSDDLPVKAGLLLVNLGTPAAPTARALRPYLAEFLGDPRVIEYPRWLWWLILHGVILRIRPPRSAHAYQRVWTPQGSPLRVGSEALAAALQETLSRRMPGPVKVALAMRYGQPSVAAQIEQLMREGVRRLLVLPLYPQYSGTSTGSVLDAVADSFKTLRWPPELRVVNDYHDDPGHIEALARSIEDGWREHGRGDRLLLSFHGIPQRYTEAGDPYFLQCQRTAALLRARLGLEPAQLIVSFQSRVGREPWLQPYTDATVRELAAQGVKRLDVACPGFAVDCLETLEEIAMQNRDFFLEAGGQELRYIPALNHSQHQVDSLAELALRHMQGWPERGGA